MSRTSAKVVHATSRPPPYLLYTLRLVPLLVYRTLFPNTRLYCSITLPPMKIRQKHHVQAPRRQAPLRSRRSTGKKDDSHYSVTSQLVPYISNAESGGKHDGTVKGV